MLAIRGHLFYNSSIKINHSPIIMNKAEAIANRIKSNDNFENVAYVCCDWEEFVFEVAEWGVDHIAGVDFLDPEVNVGMMNAFFASFGCTPDNPHPAGRYA